MLDDDVAFCLFAADNSRVSGRGDEPPSLMMGADYRMTPTA
jgi:hypothetical protein